MQLKKMYATQQQDKNKTVVETSWGVFLICGGINKQHWGILCSDNVTYKNIRFDKRLHLSTKYH